jgi:WD40 repeat protein
MMKIQIFILMTTLHMLSSSFAEELDDDEDNQATPNHATELTRYTQRQCNHNDPNDIFAFTPARQLAMGCDDGSVLILDPKTSDTLWRSPPDHPNLKGLLFPNDQTMATLTAEGHVTLYNLQSQEKTKEYTLKIDAKINQARAASDVILISTEKGSASNNHMIAAFSALNGDMISSRAIERPVNNVALSPSGQRVAWVAGSDEDGKYDTVMWLEVKKLSDAVSQSFTCELHYAFSALDISSGSVLIFSPNESKIAFATRIYRAYHYQLGLCVQPINKAAITQEFVRNLSADLLAKSARFSKDSQYLEVISYHMEMGREAPSVFRGYDTFIVNVDAKIVRAQRPHEETTWQHTETMTSIEGIGHAAILDGKLLQMKYERQATQAQ